MNHLAVQPINANIIDLRGLLSELVENKRFILSLMFCALLCGIFYNCLQVPHYSADVLVRVQENESPSLSNIALSRTAFRDNKNAAMYSALLHSRYILSPTINALGLNVIAKPDEWPILDRLFPSHNKIQLEKFAVPSYLKNKPLLLILNAPGHFRLYEKTRLLLEGPIGRRIQNADGTILLQVQQLQGKIGSRFVIIKQADDKIIKELLPHLKVSDLGIISEKNEKTGILQVSYVDKDPARLVDVLNTAIRILQQKNVEQKSMKAKETLTFLLAQLPATKQSLEKAETVFNTYRAAAKKLDIRVEMQFLLHELADIDKQLTMLRLNRRALLQENTREHPFIHAIDEKTKSLLLERKELEAKLKLLPASDQIAVSLMRDIKVKHELYLLLLKKIQELKIEEASTISDIQILSWANLPYAPLPAHRGLILFASVVVGFVLGCMLIFMRKVLFPKVNDPYWIEQHLGLANVAIVPYSQRQKVLSAKKLLAQEHPEDRALEALRSLRTSLQVLLCGASNNIVSLISLSPQIGKSFIAANFAYLLAEAGKRVLLIDGDLRQGHLQDYFNIKRAPGLSEVINNTYVLEQALHLTMQPNLTLLTTGTYPTHPSELLMQARCGEIIKTLSLQYDIVIMDTAPVLAVTDAAIISQFAGTNFLILGADTHQVQEIELAVKQLSRANVKLQGSIYNNLQKEQRLVEMLRLNYHYAYEQ